MAFLTLARIAVTSITGALSSFLPSALTRASLSGGLETSAQLACRAALRRSSSQGVHRALLTPRAGFWDPVPTSQARARFHPHSGKRLSFEPSSSATNATRSAPAPKHNPIRVLQAVRNSVALSMEEPLRSCFRKCRPNETVGLPSSLPSRRSYSSSNRQVIFSDPIDDAGNNPRHASITPPEDETGEEWTSYRPLPPRRSTVPARTYKITPYTPAAVKFAEEVFSRRPRTLSTPPKTFRSRVVAYSF
ncbi:hypothetical protein JCM16303_006061 [Sporobolomyces ruberrimus]